MNDHGASLIQEAIEAALQKHPTCRIGLCGGRSPQALYETLARLDLPWHQLLFVQIDERHVSEHDADSNQKMIRAAFSKRSADFNFLHFDTSLSWEDSAKQMNESMVLLIREREPIFDILLLGVGDDGHVASIFKGDETYDPSLWASRATTTDHAVPERLTLTLKTLISSSQIFFVMPGESKKTIRDKVRNKMGLPQAATQLLEQVKHVILAD